MYDPSVGEIIKVYNWHAVVLDKFTNDQGSVVLYVHTLRNVFRGYAPEYINLDLATEDGITPATRQDLERELQTHQALRKTALESFFAAIKVADKAEEMAEPISVT
jgi:hypothetical protein